MSYDPVSRPAAEIWALVEGIPTQERRDRRPLLILRAYIDDSGVEQEPISVLGGFIAEAERWAAFSDAWAEALTLSPRLEIFKTNDAYARRDERIPYLFTLIKEFNLRPLSVSISPDAYRSLLLGRYHKLLNKSYYFMFSTLVGLVYTLLNDRPSLLRSFFGAEKLDRIDFVFDDQPGQMEQILASWREYKEKAPNRIKPLIGDPPVFRDDRYTLPLQAADLWAWYIRARTMNDAFSGKYDLSLFKRAESLNGLDLPISGKMLEMVALILSLDEIETEELAALIAKMRQTITDV